MSEIILKFIQYKENIAKQYKMDWKEYYIKDCLLIYVDSKKTRDTLNKQYPPEGVFEVGEILSISKDNELRCIFTSIDVCYPDYSMNDKKEIYFYLTQIQKNML